MHFQFDSVAAGVASVQGWSSMLLEIYCIIYFLDIKI